MLRAPKPRLTETILFNLSVEMKQNIQQLADEKDLSLARVVRQAVAEMLEPDLRTKPLPPQSVQANAVDAVMSVLEPYQRDWLNRMADEAEVPVMDVVSHCIKSRIQVTK